MDADDILVLGLGNILLADDGVGVHVIRRLAQDASLPDGVRVVDGGTMGFRLTGMFADAGGVLIIDAAELLAPPGTLRLLESAALAGHAGARKKSSAHEAGLADLLGLLALEACAPRHLAVLAIQPEVIDWRETLSASVENTLAPACAMIKDIAREWQRAA